jgi:hypothetical protein
MSNFRSVTPTGNTRIKTEVKPGVVLGSGMGQARDAAQQKVLADMFFGGIVGPVLVTKHQEEVYVEVERSTSHTATTEWRTVRVEYSPADEAALEAAGYVRQSSRTTDGWLVHYSHPETWETTPTKFLADEEV